MWQTNRKFRKKKNNMAKKSKSKKKIKKKDEVLGSSSVEPTSTVDLKPNLLLNKNKIGKLHYYFFLKLIFRWM